MPDLNLSALPSRLYRFRTFGTPWSGGADKAAVYDLLRSRVRFARLCDFNDPFEGRPCVVPAFPNAGAQREAVHRYVYEIHRSTGKSAAESRKQADAFVAGKTQAEIIEWAGERLVETLSQHGALICCLSGEEATRAPLTWSHYADHHRGVVIHFDTRFPPFCFSYPVVYSDKYPEVLFPRTHQDQWEHVQRCFFTKSSLWSYEHEYRILKIEWPAAGRDPRAAALLVEWAGPTAIAPPEAVVGVTIGARMQPAERTELMARIEAEFPRLEIWEAKLHRSRYEIGTERIK